MKINLDVRDIPGTNCYLDDDAKDKIRKIIDKCGFSGVHFIGSGNYHYISYLFLERIRGDFNLIVFDNHPDMQEPAFGNILSCGSWVRQAICDFPNLKNVYICGASPEHIAEESPFPEGAYAVQSFELSSRIPKDLPIYISIDKDILSHEFAATDWDQGNMSLSELCSALNELSDYDILGIDVCGDKKTEPNGSEIEINAATDSALLKLGTFSKCGV